MPEEGMDQSLQCAFEAISAPGDMMKMATRTESHETIKELHSSSKLLNKRLVQGGGNSIVV